MSRGGMPKHTRIGFPTQKRSLQAWITKTDVTDYNPGKRRCESEKKNAEDKFAVQTDW